MRMLPRTILLLLITSSLNAQWVQTNGPYGGQINCLAVSPNGAGGANIFAGTADAGVFLSTNNGTTWTAVNTGLTSTYVLALAVSGANLFAGTDQGVFLSTNSGTTWTSVNNGLTNTGVQCLAVSGTNLFAGTNGGGVFLSTNNAANWTGVGLPYTSVSALALSGAYLFAGTWGGIFLSSNNGTNWSAVNTGLTSTSVLAVAVSGANLFAGTDQGVFLSTNSGTTWTGVNTGLTNTYVQCLAVSGTNLFAGTSDGLFLSMDNGTSWTAVNTGLTNTFVLCLAASPNGAGGTNLFAGTNGGGVFLSTNNAATWTAVGLTRSDVNALAIIGTNLFAGTDGGDVFLSTNNGASWINTGLNITSVPEHAGSRTNLIAGSHHSVVHASSNGSSVYSLAVSGANLFAGTSSGVYRSTDNGSSWTAVGLTNTPVNALAVSPATGGTSGTNLYAGTAYSDVFLSTDNGANWTDFGWTFSAVNALAVIGTNLFAGTSSDVLLLCTGDGTSWWAGLDTGWTSWNSVWSLAVCPNGTGGTNLYAGTQSGVFLNSWNTGWEAVGSTNMKVRCLAVSNGGLFAGTEGGVSFYSFSSTGWKAVGLTNMDVRGFAVTGTNLFAGTRGSGVWRRALTEMQPKIALTNGNNQSGRVGTALSNPFVVTVTDAGGDPVSGVTVVFAIATVPTGATGQTLSTTTTTTNSSGQASSRLTIGNKAGTYTVTATSSGLAGSPITFTATATVGVATAISIASGNNQSKTIATALANPFVVTVTDAGGSPISGATVSFAVGTVPTAATGQSLSTTNATTNSSGQASTILTLGNKVGTYTVIATSSGLTGSPITFTATATAGAATAIVLASGNNQSGTMSTVLPNPFVVTVTDVGGNPVSGASVGFALGSAPTGATGQSLSATTASTNSNGQASTVLTLGNLPGTYTITATSSGLGGSPITFTATASAAASVAIDIPLTIGDGGSTQQLRFGLNPSATDGLDATLGESGLPPIPPSGVFDARLVGSDIGINLGLGSLKDYRQGSITTTGTRIYEIQYQVGSGSSIIISWNFTGLPIPVSGVLQDLIAGSIVNVPMSGSGSYTVTNPGGISKLKMIITYGSIAATASIGVNAGWCIVSVPVQTSDMTVSTIFPDVTGPAYGFAGITYATATTLVPGKGYWLELPAVKSYRISGTAVRPAAIPVNAGWNMIGGYEFDIATSSITSSIVASPFYGYSNGYTAATSLTAGKGYWVKASSAGTLTAEAPSASIAGEPNNSAAEQPLGSITVRIVDNTGQCSVLYLSESGRGNELPPIPPQGVFDVRFASNTLVETSGDPDHEVLLNSVVYPVTITAQGVSGKELWLSDGIGGTIVHQRLEEGKGVTIRQNLSKVVITEKSQAANIPLQYELSQNYPNPFNPTTMIQYALVEGGFVQLSVYDVLGNKVADLVQGQMSAGTHQVQFNALNVSSGVYYYRLTVNGYVATRKLVVVK